MFITLWDIKELTHYTQRVGHEVTGVVVCFSVTYYGLGGQSLRDITFSKLLLNSRVHSAHAIHQLANEKRDCKIPVIVTIWSIHRYSTLPKTRNLWHIKQSYTTLLTLMTWTTSLNRILEVNVSPWVMTGSSIKEGKKELIFTNSV